MNNRENIINPMSPLGDHRGYSARGQGAGSYKYTGREVTTFKPGSLLAIPGTIGEIISTKKLMDGKLCIEFILIVKTIEYTQYYTIKAFSDTGHDRYNIEGRKGQTLTLNCYFNGSQKNGTNGKYYRNDLALHSIHQ